MVRKGTVGLTTGSAPSGNTALLWSNSVSLNSGEVIAVRPQLPATISGVQGNVGQPFAQISGTSSRYSGSDGGTFVDYYVFSSALISQAPSPGLQVWRSNGNLSYDSGTKPLHIVDVVDGEGTFTYQSGRLYACIHSVQKFQAFDPGGSAARMVGNSRNMIVGTPNGIRITYGVTDTLQWPATSTNYASLTPFSTMSRHIICDVTNY